MRFAIRTSLVAVFVAAIAIATTGLTNAQVPPEIAKQLLNIGRGVCVLETAQVYQPLHPKPPYPDVLIGRDNSFGPDPANVVDIFAPKKGKGSLPVLIYVSGGAGNRQQGGPNGEPFYDNVMLWAVKNGMVGVNMQRRAGQTWDDPAKDISIALFWLNKNISKFRGNPKRMFIWAQSAGNVPVSTYVGHPEYWGPQGVSIKGVIFMSPPAINILPATPPPVQAGAGGFGACGRPDGQPVGQVQFDLHRRGSPEVDRSSIISSGNRRLGPRVSRSEQVFQRRGRTRHPSADLEVALRARRMVRCGAAFAREPEAVRFKGEIDITRTLSDNEIGARRHHDHGSGVI